MDRLSRRNMEALLGHARMELGRPELELELKLKGMWAAKKKLNKIVWVHWQQMKDLGKWFPLMNRSGNLILRMKADTSDVFVFCCHWQGLLSGLTVPSSKVYGRKLLSTIDN